MQPHLCRLLATDAYEHTHGQTQTSHLNRARHRDTEGAETPRGHIRGTRTCIHVQTHKNEGFRHKGTVIHTHTEAGVQHKIVHRRQACTHTAFRCTRPYTDILADTNILQYTPGHPHVPVSHFRTFTHMLILLPSPSPLSCFSGLTLRIRPPCYHMGWAIWPGASVRGEAGRIWRKAGARKEN